VGFDLQIAVPDEEPAHRFRPRHLWRSIKQAFFEDVNASQLAFRTWASTDLYVQQATRFIEAAGGEIRSRCTVQRLEIRDGQVKTVVLRSGERLPADGVITERAAVGSLRLFAAGILSSGTLFWKSIWTYLCTDSSRFISGLTGRSRMTFLWDSWIPHPVAF